MPTITCPVRGPNQYFSTLTSNLTANWFGATNQGDKLRWDHANGVPYTVPLEQSPTGTFQTIGYTSQTTGSTKKHNMSRMFLTFDLANAMDSEMGHAINTGNLLPDVYLRLYVENKYDTLTLGHGLWVFAVPLDLEFMNNGQFAGNIDTSTAKGNHLLGGHQCWLSMNHINQDLSSWAMASTCLLKESYDTNGTDITIGQYNDIPLTSLVEEYIWDCMSWRQLNRGELNTSVSSVTLGLIHELDISNMFSSNNTFNSNSSERQSYRVCTPSYSGREPELVFDWTEDSDRKYTFITQGFYAGGSTSYIRVPAVSRMGGVDFFSGNRAYMAPLDDANGDTQGVATRGELKTVPDSGNHYLFKAWPDEYSNSINFKRTNTTHLRPTMISPSSSYPAAYFIKPTYNSKKFSRITMGHQAAVPLAFNEAYNTSSTPQQLNNCFQVQKGSLGTQSSWTGPTGGPNGRDYLVLESSGWSNTIQPPYNNSGGGQFDMNSRFYRSDAHGATVKYETENIPMYLFESEPEISFEVHAYGKDIKSIAWYFRPFLSGKWDSRYLTPWQVFDRMHIDGTPGTIGDSIMYGEDDSNHPATNTLNNIDTHWPYTDGSQSQSPWLTIRLDKEDPSANSSNFWEYCDGSLNFHCNIRMKFVLECTDPTSAGHGTSNYNFYRQDVGIGRWHVKGDLKDRTVDPY